MSIYVLYACINGRTNGNARTNDEHIGVTAHYINVNWNRVNATVAFFCDLITNK